MAKHKDRKRGGAKKYGRNRAKCASYRARIGRPRGPGVSGNKRGKNAGG